jgi:CBS domain-containing protein
MQVNRRLNRLIVVDGHGRLAGVCSRGDIMRATLEHFRWVSITATL